MDEYQTFIATVALGNDISDWQVSDKASLSDHCYITYTLKKHDNITLTLQNEITTIAFTCYKKKNRQ